MRKIMRWGLACFLLVACSPSQERTKIHVFYADTCQTCQLLQSDFLPEISADERLEIVLHDIDEEESQDLYQDILTHLDLPQESNLKTQLNVPFIVLDQYFVAVGYNEGMKELYLRLINDCLNDTMDMEEIASGIWFYQ